ncbi:epimerase [Burkholderia oklahomensis]|uniref:epimerase n=1 Tax=Burkholderia oklahomensis TaxID=342113 RepID=UPI00016A83A8|nr:epimerase [Burkholderia oklahomensis]AJX32083.1 NAD-dependent epimerase/dehydratase domain protein [Burkholderia oklahomensis C6786]MBI0358230.1 epimerase [Burkholderia oklahomensis]SUW56156.1 Uncharacterised protein [Burkholderia oklahomensis]
MSARLVTGSGGPIGFEVVDTLAPGFIRACSDAPRAAEVHNLGGGADNSLSAIDALGRASGRKPAVMSVACARIGDHICYLGDPTRGRTHTPDGRTTTTPYALIDEMTDGLRVAEGVSRPSYHAGASHARGARPALMRACRAASRTPRKPIAKASTAAARTATAS